MDVTARGSRSCPRWWWPAVVSLCSAWCTATALAQPLPQQDGGSPSRSRKTVDGWLAGGPARFDLRPSTVAQAANQPDTSSTEAGEARSEHAAAPNEVELSDGITGLVRAADATTKQQTERGVEGTIWTVMQPWRGMNILLRDVRYWYLGRGFDAVIANDGHVEFHDKEGLGLTPTPVMLSRDPRHKGQYETPAMDKDKRDAADQLHVSGTGALGAGIGVADPGAMLGRLRGAQDRNAAERREFLQKTRGLRDYLAAQNGTRPQPIVDQRILARLDKLWQGRDIPLSRQQSETAALWDSFEDDALGDRGRALVEDFIQRLSEARGACPFDSQSLARLRTHRPFRPCEPQVEQKPDRGAVGDGRR